MRKILILCILALFFLPSIAAETTVEYGDGTLEIKDGPLYRRVTNMATMRNWNGEYAPAPIYFIDIGDYVAESTTPNYRIQFQNSPKTKLISMNSSVLDLEMSVDGFTTTVNGDVQNPFANSLARWGNHIYYDNVDTNVSYTLTQSGIKEDVIIKAPIEEFVNGGNGIMLRYSVQAQNAILLADGSPVTSPQMLHHKKTLKFKQGNSSYELGLPTLEAEAMAPAILDYTVDPVDVAAGKYRIFVNIDTTDLLDEQQYPVIIDPTVTTLSSGTPNIVYPRAYSHIADNAILTGAGIVSGWNNTASLPTTYYQDVDIYFMDAKLWHETKYNSTYIVCGYQGTEGWVGLFDVNGSSGITTLQHTFSIPTTEPAFLLSMAFDNHDLQQGRVTYYIAGRTLASESNVAASEVIWKVELDILLSGGYDLSEWSRGNWLFSTDGNVIKDIDYINSMNTLVVTSRELVGTILSPTSWLPWTISGDELHRYDVGIDDGDVDSTVAPKDGGIKIYMAGHTGSTGTDGVLIGYDAITHNSILYHTLPSNVGACFGVSLNNYENRAWISCRHSLLSTESWILEMELIPGSNNPNDYASVPGRVNSLVGINDGQGLIGIKTPGIVIVYGIDTTPAVTVTSPAYGEVFTPITGVQQVTVEGFVYSNETQPMSMTYWFNDTAGNTLYTSTTVTFTTWGITADPIFTYRLFFYTQPYNLGVGEWNFDIVVNDGTHLAKNQSYFTVIDTTPGVTVTFPAYGNIFQKIPDVVDLPPLALRGVVYSNETQNIDVQHWINNTPDDIRYTGIQTITGWVLAPDNPIYTYKSIFSTPLYVFDYGEWNVDVIANDGANYAVNRSYFLVTGRCIANIVLPVNHSTHKPGYVHFEGILSSFFETWQGLDGEPDNTYTWSIYDSTTTYLAGSTEKSFDFMFVEEGVYNITFKGFDGSTNSPKVWKHITIYDPPELPDPPIDDNDDATDFIPDDDGGVGDGSDDDPDITEGVVEKASYLDQILSPFNTLISIIIGFFIIMLRLKK